MLLFIHRINNNPVKFVDIIFSLFLHFKSLG